MTYHLTSVRKAIINKQQVLARMWRKGNPSALVVGMQTGAATVENSMEFPQNIKNGAAFWPSNYTSGNVFEETQNTNSKEYMHPCVHCSESKMYGSITAPLSRWVIPKMWYLLYNRVLFGHKNESITFQTAWMDLVGMMLNKMRRANTM